MLPVVITMVQPFGGQEKMEVVQLVVQLVLQLYTILRGQEKDEVTVQGHQSFQLLMGKENES